MGSNDQDTQVRSTDPKVRSACDRCRSQKLKCDQSSTLNVAGKCSRCVKSKAECTTSAPRPSGRPSRQQQQQQQQQRKQNKARKTNRLWDLENIESQPSSSIPETGHLTPRSTTVTTLSGQCEDTATRFDIFDASIFTSFSGEEFPFDPTLFTANKEYPTNAPYGMHEDSQADMAMLELDISAGSATDLWLRKGTLPHLLVNQDKSYQLKKLAELNSTLLQHLSVVDKLVYGDCCKVNPLGVHHAPSQHYSLHSHHADSNLGVKSMLSYLQDFISIMGYFLMFTPITSAPRLTTSYLDGSEEEMNSNCSDIDFEEVSLPEGRNDIHECSADTDNEVPFATQKTARNARTTNEPLIDYPTILALITCYVSLVRLHRTAFNRILSSLETSSKRATVPSYKDLPPLLPNLDLAGFSLKMHRTIQISVFMNVALELLWRAERGITAIAAAERNSVATTSSGHMELLKTMLKQEAVTAGPSTQNVGAGAIGRHSLKILAGEIRTLCRGHVCLQLEETTFPLDTAGATFDAGMEFAG